jgi:hypothetical protein
MTMQTIPFSSDDIRSQGSYQSFHCELGYYPSIKSTAESDQYLLRKAFENSVVNRRRGARDWLIEKEAIIRKISTEKRSSLPTHLISRISPFWLAVSKESQQVISTHKKHTANPF